jgi:two-component system, LuxR family, response regulator FixJ
MASFHSPSSSGQGTPCAVVLIDDDEAVRGALAFLLEIEGFRVATYASGEELLRWRMPPECCCYVIDHELPGIDGIELLSQLRSAGALAPALLITTSPSARVRARATLAGTEIVEKPLLGDGFVRAVKRLSCTAQVCAPDCIMRGDCAR